jgi:hypothetical protein
LARTFVFLAVAQLGAGLWCLLRPGKPAATSTAVLGLGALVGWGLTRTTGIGFVDGLEASASPQLADAAAALLATVSAGAAFSGLVAGRQPIERPRLALPLLAAAALAVPAMVDAGTHGSTASGGHAHGGAHVAAAPDGSPTTAHTDDHGDDHSPNSVTTPATTVDPATMWPRPWDPTQPIDVSGVAGVSAEQQARATALIEDSLRELPRFADTADAIAAGYVSIGDAGTGSEHFINPSLVQDDVMLDPSEPESLVYDVDGDTRTLAGAMFIASARPTDDPSLTEWAGPLMQWHNHGDLCWEGATVVGVIDDSGSCARGANSGGEFPMVHVWITPHPCGVFAALEGVGAGQTAVPEEQRVDMCHGDHHGTQPTIEPKPYDPALPIDLGGIAGVTPQQQAAAENIVAENVMRLPQWADPSVAEAAGFRSIGDGASGHEHYVNWKWIDDDVTLNPDYPESLVYEPQPDGSKKLVSAMYMLPPSVGLDEVPDIGGALMQWHFHDDLCFTPGDHPQVATVQSPDTPCPAPLERLPPSPMIHVWITAHPCGPFAALEGVGAGQILAGQQRLCDTAHGSHG